MSELAEAAGLPPFLLSSLLSIIKATAMPNLSAITLLLTELQKVAHPPPPPF